ncbi:hypothetical protein P43SY_007274 [Pythium insidiosum]|uniref:Uncharacterized protein n=1 Tax=Pythium insidiosum TaxID=114742 RepID=A0AAD5M3F4_PYTIN|nr:hypothetical protein P43SY_007274 [Pythium insidiosum]KAJ0394374.1 hypothetical protein ATCC90586_003034 [Pythium insidiosum]
MWFSNYRQRLQLLVIIFFTFIAFAAAEEAWMPWATLVIFLSMFLVADLLFLDDSQFQYNPDYKNWIRATDPKY